MIGLFFLALAGYSAVGWHGVWIAVMAGGGVWMMVVNETHKDYQSLIRNVKYYGEKNT